MTVNKNNRCALVRYSGKNPFSRCRYCNFPLYKCLSFRVSLSFLAVTFLAVLLANFSNSFSRIYLVAIIGILLFISWIIYLETDRIIEREHRAQEVLKESQKDKEEIRHHYDTQFVVSTLLKYSLEDTSLDEIFVRSLDLILSVPWLAFETKGSISIVEHEKDILIMKAHRGIGKELEKLCARIGFGVCHCGRAAMNQEICFSRHVDENHEHCYEGMEPHGHYCVPILSGGETLGIINVYIQDGHTRDPKEDEFLLTVANVLAGIIERKRGETALRESEETTRALLNAPMDVAHLLDSEGRILATNEVGAQRLNMDSRELIGKNIYDLFSFDVGRRRKKIHNRVVRTGESIRFEDERDGKVFDNSLYPVCDNQGNVVRVAVFARDITESKKAEKERKIFETQLNQAQKMQAIGALAGGIAHDFNNILGVIIGNTEMTWEDVPEKSREKENLEQVLIAARRASELVKQILVFSRQSQPEPQPVKVSLIIKEVLKLIRASLPSSIEIRQILEADTDIVMADSTQMHQVMMNLCTNAGHAMMKQPGGLLDISLTNVNIDGENLISKPGLEPGTFLKLTVQDTGCGISPLILERIFEPYYTTKETGEGTGLGLAVVSGIVESHNGTITVESKPGKGTAFHVYLPVATQTVAEKNPDDIPIPGGSERVLFIDDEKSLVKMGTLMLEGLGYDVVGVTDPEEALNIFNDCCDTIDLVITDQTMPKMTGMDLARIFMGIRSDIPVILCTGYSRTVSPEEAIAVGIRKFIMKPINTRQIAYIMREVLDGDQNAKEAFN